MITDSVHRLFSRRFSPGHRFVVPGMRTLPAPHSPIHTIHRIRSSITSAIVLICAGVPAALSSRWQ